ncbi:unnamed protein product [Brachionus calyciflorus]|uniref:Uncharacterized protein n=1 Tax=Brachionus calyciflorus TaxID=104777 RepID=A0A814JR08_9BILA|nr:unnamed protein product [Brachionus calyciflorus]
MFFKQLVQNVITDHDIPLMDAYNRHYQKLIAKYSYNEIAEYWKPFTTINQILAITETRRNQTTENKQKIYKSTKNNQH